MLWEDRNGFSKIEFQWHAHASQEGSLSRPPCCTVGLTLPRPVACRSLRDPWPPRQTCPGPSTLRGFLPCCYLQRERRAPPSCHCTGTAPDLTLCRHQVSLKAVLGATRRSDGLIKMKSLTVKLLTRLTTPSLALRRVAQFLFDG